MSAAQRPSGARPSPTALADAALLDASRERAARRRAQRREPATVGVSLTSMIDVVFLLLVYFMVATRFRTGEEVYRMDLPERAGAAAAVDPFELDEEPLRIRVSSTGRLRPAYRIRIDGPYPQPDTFAELRTWLRSVRIGGAAGGLFPADHPVVVDPADDATWQLAVAAFDAAAAAGYERIDFADGGGP